MYRAIFARLGMAAMAVFPAPGIVNAEVQHTAPVRPSLRVSSAPVAYAPAAGRMPVPSAQPAALGCLIEASAVVEVGASVIGVLDSVNAERGDVVSRGQVLARLEAGVERAAVALAQAKASTQADVESAQSQKAFAARKAQRTAELTELKFVSVQARDQAETEASMASQKLAQTLEQQVLSARELQLARAQLAQRTITSPLNGVVTERYLSAGERVENRPILKVAQIDPLRVEVVLPASMFNTVKSGMSVLVRPELQGATVQTATVSIVDRVIDAASNTFRARLTLPNRDLGLPSGVRCKVEFGSTAGS